MSAIQNVITRSPKTSLEIPLSNHTLMSLQEVADSHFNHLPSGPNKMETVANRLLEFTAAFIIDRDNGFTYRMAGKVWEFDIGQYEQEPVPSPSGPLRVAVPDVILLTNYTQKGSDSLALTDAQVASYALRWALLTFITFEKKRVCYRIHFKQSWPGDCRGKKVRESLSSLFQEV